MIPSVLSVRVCANPLFPYTPPSLYLSRSVFLLMTPSSETGSKNGECTRNRFGILEIFRSWRGKVA